MKVLSLFDGISCGRIALEKAGIPVEKYYASEIDKYAIQISQKNYPDIIQVGDVCKLDFNKFKDVDLLIGGSPCQDLSIAKQNRQGLYGERSKLFWEYVKALSIIKPKYFLLENVASMKVEDRDAITTVIKAIYPETECTMINSALVSAQQRKRLYWCNWTVTQPEDKGILLKDILESGEAWGEKGYCLTANYNGAFFPHDFLRKQRQMVAEHFDKNDRCCCSYNRKSGIGKEIDKSYSLCASDYRGLNRNQNQTGVVIPCALRSRDKRKQLEVRKDDKSNAMTSVQSDSVICEPVLYNQYNQRTMKEKSGVFTTASASRTAKNGMIVYTPIRLGQIGNGGQGQRIYSVRGKSVCLSANGGGLGAKTGLYKIDLPDGDYNVRKLTPVEAERLQTLPDNYTEGISNTQRYRAIGNGWTVDVIVHILTSIKNKGVKKWLV